MSNVCASGFQGIWRSAGRGGAISVTTQFDGSILAFDDAVEAIASLFDGDVTAGGNIEIDDIHRDHFQER